MLVLVAIVVINTLADYYLKLGSLEPRIFTTWHTHVGALLYAMTAYGWVFMMTKANLTVIGALYSSMTIVILSTMGVAIFKEVVTARQLLGAALAITAILVTATE